MHIQYIFDVLSSDHGGENIEEKVSLIQFQKEQRKYGVLPHDMELFWKEWNHDIDHVHVMFAQPKRNSVNLSMLISAGSRLLKKSIRKPRENYEKKAF